MPKRSMGGRERILVMADPFYLADWVSLESRVSYWTVVTGLLGNVGENPVCRKASPASTLRRVNYFTPWGARSSPAHSLAPGCCCTLWRSVILG